MGCFVDLESLLGFSEVIVVFHGYWWLALWLAVTELVFTVGWLVGYSSLKFKRFETWVLRVANDWFHQSLGCMCCKCEFLIEYGIMCKLIGWTLGRGLCQCRASLLALTGSRRAALLGGWRDSAVAIL